MSILVGIEIEAQRRVAWLCYFEGLNCLEMADLIKSTPEAVRKSLQRSRRTLGPEKDACLRVWRKFAFPQARKLRSIEARPEMLLEVVTGE